MKKNTFTSRKGRSITLICERGGLTAVWDVSPRDAGAARCPAGRRQAPLNPGVGAA